MGPVQDGGILVDLDAEEREPGRAHHAFYLTLFGRIEPVGISRDEVEEAASGMTELAVRYTPRYCRHPEPSLADAELVGVVGN
jgi:hypothetical protein